MLDKMLEFKVLLYNGQEHNYGTKFVHKILIGDLCLMCVQTGENRAELAVTSTCGKQLLISTRSCSEIGIEIDKEIK